MHETPLKTEFKSECSLLLHSLIQTCSNEHLFTSKVIMNYGKPQKTKSKDIEKGEIELNALSFSFPLKKKVPFFLIIETKNQILSDESSSSSFN